MEDHENATTKLSKLSFTGSKGETLNISSKHRLIPSFSSDEILGPEDGLLELRIGVRVDRKLVKSEELLQSGFLRAVYRFFREHGIHLRISSIEEAEPGENKTVTIPLQLEQLPEDLAPRNPNRLQSIYAQFIFYSSDKIPLSRLAPDLKKQLLSPDMSPNLQSLVFRSLQKFSMTLASKYPLILNGNHTNRLIRDHRYLHVLAKSLARMTNDLPIKLAQVARIGFKRMNVHSPTSTHQMQVEESQQIPDDLDDLLEQASQIQPRARPEAEITLESALSSLARHATKRKKVFSTADMITPEISEAGSPGQEGNYDEEVDDGSETIYGHVDDDGHLLLCSLLDDIDDDDDDLLAVFARDSTPSNVYDGLPPENFQDTYNEQQMQISQALDDYEEKALEKWSRSKRFPLPQGTTLGALGDMEVLEELLAMNSSQSFRLNQQETTQAWTEASTSALFGKRYKKRVIEQGPEIQSLPPGNESRESAQRHSPSSHPGSPIYVVSDDEEETSIEVTMHEQGQIDTAGLWSRRDAAETDVFDDQIHPGSHSSQESVEQHDSGYSTHSSKTGKKRTYEELEFDDTEVMDNVEAGIATLMEKFDAGETGQGDQDDSGILYDDENLYGEHAVEYRRMQGMQRGQEDDLLLWVLKHGGRPMKGMYRPSTIVVA